MSKADANEVTAAITRFVTSTVYDSIPSAVIELGKGHILDSLGCGLAGSASRAAAIARGFLLSGGGARGPCSTLGTDEKLSARFAAFANGLSMHADDFDDTGPQPSPDRNGGIHATVPVLATALALSEEKGLSGRDLMEAVHIGVEISCKLNHAINSDHYRRGFHSTATLGVFGATCAAARIFRLDPQQINCALGIAASHSSGLRGNFGSMMNPLHAGHAAECGLVSAALARSGFTSSPNLLDEPKIGYFQAMAGGYIPEALIDKLGRPWAFVDPGMWIKPFPCGALTHPLLTTLISLANAENLSPEGVRSIRVQTNQHLVDTLIHNRPRSALQAKFSMPFAAALALCRRRVTLGDFSDETVSDPPIRNLMEKVEYSAYPRREAGYTNVTTLITVHLVDGRTFDLRADYGKGNPKLPMTFEDLAEKFRGCAEQIGMAASAIAEAVETVRSLDALDDVRRLTALLQAPRK